MTDNSPRWVKSSHSMQNGDCTEIRAGGADAATDVRDSKDTARGHLTIAPASWIAFTATLRADA
jgi:uncharacterized protein DUF397